MHGRGPTCSTRSSNLTFPRQGKKRRRPRGNQSRFPPGCGGGSRANDEADGPPIGRTAPAAWLCPAAPAPGSGGGIETAAPLRGFSGAKSSARIRSVVGPCLPSTSPNSSMLGGLGATSMSASPACSSTAMPSASPCKPARRMASHHTFSTSSSRTAQVAHSSACDQDMPPDTEFSLCLNRCCHRRRFIWAKTCVSRGCSNQVIPAGT